jgi:hypothetical protein
MAGGTSVLASLLLLCFVGLPACAGETDSKGDREPDAARNRPAGSEVVAQEKIDSCAGITAAEAAPLVGAAPSVIEATNVRQHSTLRICGYSIRSGSGSVAFSLSWEPTVEKARAQFEREHHDLGLANRVAASAGGTAAAEAAFVDVLGLGDEAFWTPVNGTTVARVGNVRVQVMSPADRQNQTAVAQLVVKGLK